MGLLWLFRGFISVYWKGIQKRNGGEWGIRTPGAREGSSVFKTGAFNHSANSPLTKLVTLAPLRNF